MALMLDYLLQSLDYIVQDALLRGESKSLQYQLPIILLVGSED